MELATSVVIIKAGKTSEFSLSAISASLEELVPFLSQRLNDEAEIDIMIDPE